MSGEIKSTFRRMADPKAHVRRDGLPDPAKIAGSGIKTREALDWMEADHPKAPAAERAIDDEALRIEASEAASQERRDAVEQMRTGWRQRSRKGRQDFETARNWEQSERQR